MLAQLFQASLRSCFKRNDTSVFREIFGLVKKWTHWENIGHADTDWTGLQPCVICKCIRFRKSVPSSAQYWTRTAPKE